jgi:hypothetical protein
MGPTLVGEPGKIAVQEGACNARQQYGNAIDTKLLLKKKYEQRNNRYGGQDTFEIKIQLNGKDKENKQTSQQLTHARSYPRYKEADYGARPEDDEEKQKYLSRQKRVGTPPEKAQQGITEEQGEEQE